MRDWLKSPPGQYLLEWESAQFDRVVADIFGYHALQMGLPELQTLKSNRMPHQWVADASLAEAGLIPTDFLSDLEALPFKEASLDLLILPHSLELSADPHATLREAERVLVPEGKLIICGFNPISLWGFKQKRSHLYKKMNLGDLYLPEAGEFISHRRLRDWLGLLNFEIDSTDFGCYKPAVKSNRLLNRFNWMDAVGRRCWPVLGAVYFTVAVKRVRGVRMIKAVKKLPEVAKSAPVSIARKLINTTAASEINIITHE